MDGLVRLQEHNLLLFSLVLARLSGMALVMPLFVEVPLKVRTLLVFTLALIVTPLQTASPLTRPATGVELALQTTGEMAVGLALGLGVAILFGSVRLAGQVTAQMGGLAMGQVYDPRLDENSSVCAQLYYLVAMAAWLTMGGHRLAVGGLLESFTVLPAGSAWLGESVAAVLSQLAAQSFVLAVRAAAPAMAALLVATVGMGLISRTLPQLNILSVGFSVNAVVTLLVLVGSISGTVWLFVDHAAPAVQVVLESLVP